MMKDETKKELFNQKDRIKAEWKTNLYTEINSNLKYAITNLGKAILEKQESRAYKLLEAYSTRAGKTIQQIKTSIDK